MRAHYLTTAAFAATLCAQEPRLSTTSRLVIAPTTVVDARGTRPAATTLRS